MRCPTLSSHEAIYYITYLASITLQRNPMQAKFSVNTNPSAGDTRLHT